MDTGLSCGGRAEICYGGGGCGGVIRTYVYRRTGRHGGLSCYCSGIGRSSATGESQVRQMNGGHGERDKDAFKEDCICYS